MSLSSLLKSLFPASVMLLGSSCAMPAFDVQPESMKEHVVWILVVAKTAQGEKTSMGSGFLVGDQFHIVTNWHVCCDRFEGERERLVYVHQEGNQFGRAQMLWSSADKDLAILKAEKATGKPPTTLASSDLIESGQTIFAVGFPGAALVGNMDTDATPKISRGIVSAKVQLPAGGGQEGFLQVDAAINKGNSGGPVFDECGRVVGIATLKSAKGEGIAWAIAVEEILPELEKLQIPVSVASFTCRPVSSSTFVALAALLGVAILGGFLVVSPRGREQVRRVVTRQRSKSVPNRIPILQGIEGYYQGTVFELNENQTWVLGRDGQAGNLVIPGEGQGISRRHCSVQFDSSRQTFLLEDLWSTNGTYLDTGQRLQPGEPVELKPGRRFFLASPAVQFEVKTVKQ